MAIVLITHDLGVVARMADEVAVMYAGEIVEHGSADDVFYGAAHPYTARPARRDAEQGHVARSRLAADRRRAAGSVRAAAGLRVLRALPVRDGALRAATPAVVRGRRAPSRALLAASSPMRRRGRRCNAEASNGAADRSARRSRSTSRSRARQVVHAVDDVSLAIAEREIVGLVGESGSGKSTFGRTLIGLHAKTAGDVLFRGEQLPAKYGPRDFRRYASEIQMIFQDPYSSLNPRMTVGEIIGEGLRLTTRRRRARRFARPSATGSCASASSAATRRATRTSSRAGSGSASASRAR